MSVELPKRNHPQAKTLPICRRKLTAIFFIEGDFVIVDKILPSSLILYRTWSPGLQYETEKPATRCGTIIAPSSFIDRKKMSRIGRRTQGIGTTSSHHHRHINRKQQGVTVVLQVFRVKD